MPGGSIETGPERLTLRLRGRVSSVEELGQLVLREKDGYILRVRDVARVEDGQEEAETAAVLERMGAHVTLRVYPGLPHTVNEDEIQHVRALVDRLLGRRSPGSG